jgi:26S proteasome regulatory subunit N1
MEPKHPEAIFKTHLEERKVGEAQLDSAKQNLAKTYVNAFVNAGLCNDLLICKKEGTDDWVFSNKDVGQMAAAASLGLLQLWDIDEGLESIDKYMERSEDYIQAGSYIALGIVNSGIKNEADAAYAILSDKLESATTEKHKIGILMGLSLAYAGSARADLLELISPIIVDSDNSIELQAIASLSIGLIFCGTCDQDAAESITQILLEKEEKDLEHSFTRIFALGLGLLYLGQQSLVETSLEVIKCLPHKNMADFVSLVMETCAYAGSGNVLNIQKLLHICAEHKEDEKESTNQIAAVIGVALIAFGEDIGQEMCLRTMNHLLQYGEPIIRRTVPLAIGLLRISNPEVQTLDLLNKLAYDSDKQVSMSAILALGLVGAGTNNSRLSGNLRYLATYFGTSPEQLFVVRVSQGLIHMGKGMMSLSPLHSNKFLFSNVSLAGLITVLYAATDMETFICGNYHYFLFYLVLSMYPRMLVTLNDKLENVKVSVKVGQAVDTVGAAGKPKTITGF